MIFKGNGFQGEIESQKKSPGTYGNHKENSRVQ